MPALTANYQKKTFEAQAKKVYNTLSVAIETYMAQEGIDDINDSDIVANGENTEVWKKFANDYFKVAQICTVSASFKDSTNKAKCFAEKYKTIDRSTEVDIQTKFGTQFNRNGTTGICFSLTDGSSLLIFKSGSSTSKDLNIIFDTNGINGPNIFGRDFFQAFVSPEGLVYDRIWKNKYTNDPDKWYKDMSTNMGTSIPGIGKLMADGWQMLY